MSLRGALCQSNVFYMWIAPLVLLRECYEDPWGLDRARGAMNVFLRQQEQEQEQEPEPERPQGVKRICF